VALSLSEDLTVSRVAERLVMIRTTLTRNVAPLEHDGLVTRGRGPDRRERYLRVTPAGRRALERALQGVQVGVRTCWRAHRRRRHDQPGSGEGH
jgi:DNA-binding MarR family transcriptional regulator